MWEIASRTAPYEEASNTLVKSLIPIGDREDLVPGCPEGYMELVQKCWDKDPAVRPEASQVLEEIRLIRGRIDIS